MRFDLVVALGLGLALGAGEVRAAGDPAAGKTAFKPCAVCHSVEAGVNKIGPTLHGIVGRHSGQVEKYSYSPANKAADVTWDPATLDKYLINPRGMIPGTKMVFAGIKNDAERANVVAYLETLK